MSTDTSKWDTDQLNLRIRNGWAQPGELAVYTRTEQVFKILNARRVKYLVMDEDGREWTVPFASLSAAPVGAVFSGPEKSHNMIKREERETAAGEFGPGDLVEFSREKDRVRFPGKYVIVKRTSAVRFSLQQVGGHRKCTAPAGILKWAS